MGVPRHARLKPPFHPAPDFPAPVFLCRSRDHFFNASGAPARAAAAGAPLWTTAAGLENFAARCYFAAMPIYEFHCEKCGRDNEILVRSSNWSGTKCPQCGSAKLAKKFSTFAAGGGSASEAPACGVGGGGGGGGGCCGGHCHGHGN
jgi:putative FmdB family regulatory protein